MLEMVSAKDHPAIQVLIRFCEEGQGTRVGREFTTFVRALTEQLPPNAEATVSMRKLLECQDCATRSEQINPDLVWGPRSAREHAAVQSMLQFFEYSPDSPACARDFYEFAQALVDTLTVNAEAVFAVRKLLESRDCALRAMRLR